MKNRKLKKGFTLVELIVVIAIIAILAAVSVVSYLAFIRQANESADIQLVKQLNTALQGDQALNGQRSTMHEMLGAMEDNGFVVENLTKTKSGYDIVWDKENNRFGLLDKDKVVYGEDSFKITDSNKYNFWKFADTEAEAKDQEYSVYLTDDFAKTKIESLSVNAGLDVGNYEYLKTISYQNTNAQEVTFRTNGGTLNIGLSDAVAKGRVHHYGPLDSAIVYTENNSFHTHGVIQYMDLKAGTVVAEENGIIYLMKAEDDTTAAEENGGVIIIPGFVTTEDVKTTNLPKGYDVTERGTTQPENIASKIAANQGLLGSGTEKDPFQIYNRETMQAISMFYTFGYKYYKVNISLTDNGRIACNDWTPVRLQGSFDGSGVEFVEANKELFAAIVSISTDGSTDNGNAGFYEGSAESFNNATPIVIENFTINSQIKGTRNGAGIAYSVGTNITFKNINVRGYIEGYTASGIAGFGAYQFGDSKSGNPDYVNFKSDITFDNVNVSATLVALNEGAAGFIQHPDCAKDSVSVWNVIDSSITSEMYAKADTNGVAKTYVYNYQVPGRIKIKVNGNDFTPSTRYTGEKAHILSVDSPKLEAPNNKGDVFTIQASDNASYANFALIISPNPGSMTATYLEERVELDGSTFKSNNVKYCDVKVNSTNGTAGYNDGSTVFNLYSTAFDGTSNGQYVQVVQYSSNGSIISISKCDLICI